MDNTIFEILNKAPLFSGADGELLQSVVSENAKNLKFVQGERILPELDGKRQLIVIISGKAQVFSNDEDRNVILRTLGKGDVFGIIGLFEESPPEISRIIAKTACKALFIPPEAFAFLLKNDEKMTFNYVGFLEKRIRFLNKKIICYTAGTAERKLAYYLDTLADEADGAGKEEQKIALDVPISSLALTLGIGRASLYRAIETLTNDGFIRKDGKDFMLLRRSEMLRKYTK